MPTTVSKETSTSGFLNSTSGIYAEPDAGFNDSANASSSSINENRAYWWFPALADLIADGFIPGVSIIDSVTVSFYVTFWSYNMGAESAWLLHSVSNGTLGTTLDSGDWGAFVPDPLYVGITNTWTLNAYNDFVYNPIYNFLNMNAGVANGMSNVVLLAQVSSGGFGGGSYDLEVKTAPWDSAHPAKLTIVWHTPSSGSPKRQVRIANSPRQTVQRVRH